MKSSKILKFYILNPNCKGKSSNLLSFANGHLKVLKTEMTFFYPNWQRTKLIINYSQNFDLNYSKMAEN